MAILLVTYDLNRPGQNYPEVHNYLKQYNHCKGLLAVWLLDTTVSPAKLRDDFLRIVDQNDRVFVTRLTAEWASYNYSCAEWLNDPRRNW